MALSATPIENHLGELWSIFDFVMPDLLGSYKDFKQKYQSNPTPNTMAILHKKIKPFLLRRIKKDVEKELPDKVEIIKYAEFSNEEIKLYESIRLAMQREIKEVISKNGLAKSQILLLDALLKLRQVCCHSSLLNIKNDTKKPTHSAKLELLLELIEELLGENKKVLVFSQFTSMLKIIQEKLDEANIKYITLTGESKNRDEIVKKFQNEDIPVFLISLKAGGVGLNLTQASSVIHYDPWWNQAVQDQATDRAYRIGQDKNVFVYKLVVKGSIEEKILELQSKKSELNTIFSNNNSMNVNDLMGILE